MHYNAVMTFSFALLLNCFNLVIGGTRDLFHVVDTIIPALRSKALVVLQARSRKTKKGSCKEHLVCKIII